MIFVVCSPAVVCPEMTVSGCSSSCSTAASHPCKYAPPCTAVALLYCDQHPDLHVVLTPLLVLQTAWNVRLEQCQEEHEQEAAHMLHLLFDSMRRKVCFMLSRDMLGLLCKGSCTGHDS